MGGELLIFLHKSAIRHTQVQQREALVESELTVARAVGASIVEAVSRAVTKPVDGVAELQPDVAASGCAKYFLERGDVRAARGDLLCYDRTAARARCRYVGRS